MPPPEKLKRKLLAPDADGDGRTDGQGNTLCPFRHSSNGGGIKIISRKADHLGLFSVNFHPAIYFVYLIVC